MGLRDRILQQQQRQTPAAPAPVPPSDCVLVLSSRQGEVTATAPLQTLRDKIKAFGVNRPDLAEAITLVAETVTAVVPRRAEPETVTTVTPVAETATPAPTVADAPPAVPKRGRPKKAEPEGLRLVTAEFAATPPGFALCVDCVPIGILAIPLSALVAPLVAAIEAETKVRHYRLIDYKAGGLLAAAMRDFLAASPPTGYVTTNTTTFEGRETLTVLETAASLVIRGLS